MPSSGEGFGFVFLEALACGIPCIGSKVDGGSEALRDGMLGKLVVPDNPQELKTAIQDTLKENKGRVPAGLDFWFFAKIGA